MSRIVCAALSFLMITACQGPVGPPEARRSAVVDTYHGVEVADEYRWLENWNDSAVQSWSEAQNTKARQVLDSLPGVDLIRERVTEILEADSVAYAGVVWTGQEYLAKKRQPPLQQPFLVALDSPDAVDAERVVLDPNRLDPSGGTSIDWYVPSPDGRLVAVSLSQGGSELGDVHLYDIATGEETDEVIPRVNGGTAGGDLAWSPDGSGFYFTRYPRPGERPDEDLSFFQEVWFHRLNTPTDEDRYELGRGLPKIAEFRLESHSGTGRVLATYQYGDSGHFQHHLREPDGTWWQLSEEEDRIVQAHFGLDGSLFMISRLDAPRGKLLRLPPGATSIDRAKVIVEEGQDTLVSIFWGSPPMAVAGDRVYVSYQLGGPSTIRAFDYSGEPQAGPAVPPLSAVSSLTVGQGDALLYSSGSYTEPRGWYRFDPATGETVKAAIFTSSSVDFSDVEVVRERATSVDGTGVPVNILRLRGVEPDGDRPTLLTGYGGFGSSRTPKLRRLWRIWLDHGGVVAEANIRGGGEFGEEWHRAGMLTRKQNCFDDFAAAMQLLIDLGYTRPSRLAIRGGSNGGLLMGAMITQQPFLSRAVVSRVGIYDMLRVELSDNGVFNIPEYGTVEDLYQFRALHGYSPFHNVTDGLPYPSVLMTTGANDPRVDPMQSRKMTARLQAATASDRPILLRTSASTGHGLATPLADEIEEETHALAFLLNELGVVIE
jgi:prolyl oligopeptidase